MKRRHDPDHFKQQASTPQNDQAVNDSAQQFGSQQDVNPFATNQNNNNPNAQDNLDDAQKIDQESKPANDDPGTVREEGQEGNQIGSQINPFAALDPNNNNTDDHGDTHNKPSDVTDAHGDQKNLNAHGEQTDPKKAKQQKKKNPAKEIAKAKAAKAGAKGGLAYSAGKSLLHNGANQFKNSWLGQAWHGAKKLWHNAVKAGKDFMHNPLQASKAFFGSVGSHIKAGASWVGTKIGHGLNSIATHVAGVSKTLGSMIGNIANAAVAHAATTGAILTGIVGGSIAIGGAYFSLNNQKYMGDICDTLPMSAAQQQAAAGNGISDSTRVDGGNEANVKKVYDMLIDKEGFSGAAAAGAAGNAWQESKGDPAIINPTNHNVAGLMQWGCGGQNGARLFAGGFIKSVDPKELTVENELKLIDYELHHSFPSQAKKYAKMTDPYEAAASWCQWYEGAPGQNEAERGNYAREFYKKWGGEKVKANDDKLKSFNGAGSTAGDPDAIAGANDATAQLLAAAICGNQGKNGGNNDAADGTGAIKEHPGGVGFDSYDIKNVPEDMKQYVPDPKKVGLSWGSSKGWSQLGGGGGQCFDFAVSYFHTIWNNPQPPGHLSGNGKDAANNAASAMGGKVTNVPHAGALASVPANVAHIAPGPYGHTFVVVHVLANGDIILLQQNFTHSGDNVGKKYTWEVGLCSKECYQKNKFMFFTPEKSKLDMK